MYRVRRKILDKRPVMKSVSKARPKILDSGSLAPCYATLWVLAGIRAPPPRCFQCFAFFNIIKG